MSRQRLGTQMGEESGAVQGGSNRHSGPVCAHRTQAPPPPQGTSTRPACREPSTAPPGRPRCHRPTRGTAEAGDLSQNGYGEALSLSLSLSCFFFFFSGLYTPSNRESAGAAPSPRKVQVCSPTSEAPGASISPSQSNQIAMHKQQVTPGYIQ